MNGTQKENSNKMLMLAMVVVVIGIIACLVMSYMSYALIKEVHITQIGESKQATTEDGIKIMNDYEIKSTLPISDAYHDGNTKHLDDRQKEILDMAKEVIDEVITDGMSDFEKEEAIYKWLCENVGGDTGLLTVIPSSEDDSDNPYGVLKYGNAVCVGYATTFRMFMQMLDIECMVIHNTDCYHSWNLVKLDDHWYHTDVYSDAGKGDYENFNMNDTICAQKNTWDMTFFPTADSLVYNMAYQNMDTLKDIYELPESLRAAMQDGRYTMFVRFEEKPDEEVMTIGNYMADVISNYTFTVDEGRVYMDYHGWMTDEKDQSTIFYVSFSLEKVADDAVDLEESVMDDISDIIDDTFGDMVYSSDGFEDYDD